MQQNQTGQNSWTVFPVSNKCNKIKPDSNFEPFFQSSDIRKSRKKRATHTFFQIIHQHGGFWLLLLSDIILQFHIPCAHQEVSVCCDGCFNQTRVRRFQILCFYGVGVLPVLQVKDEETVIAAQLSDCYSASLIHLVAEREENGHWNGLVGGGGVLSSWQCAGSKHHTLDELS